MNTTMSMRWFIDTQVPHQVLEGSSSLSKLVAVFPTAEEASAAVALHNFILDKEIADAAVAAAEAHCRAGVDLPAEPLDERDELRLADILVGVLGGLPIVHAEAVLRRADLLIRQTHRVDAIACGRQVRAAREF